MCVIGNKSNKHINNIVFDFFALKLGGLFY